MAPSNLALSSAEQDDASHQLVDLSTMKLVYSGGTSSWAPGVSNSRCPQVNHCLPRRRGVYIQSSAGPQQQAGASQQPRRPSKPSKGGGGLLATVLSLSAAPYSSYVPEPKTFLHHASAEAKQLWMVGVLLVLAAASSPALRLTIVGLLAAATVAALPRRLWEPQLRRLGGLCALLFVFTAMGSDGVAPLLADRSIPATIAGAACAAAGSAAGTAGSLPSSMAGLATGFRYVLFKLGPITITRKGLNLALSLTGLTFVALQSASLCLVTTPPERMAAAVGRALSPLRWVGLPVKELVLTVLLALRFMGTVFEECRNLCLGLASRGVVWGSLGAREVLTILLGMVTKLFANLMARCDNIAVAMAARGFVGPERHALHLGGSEAGGAATGAGGNAGAGRRLWVDVAVLGSLALFVGLSYVLV